MRIRLFLLSLGLLMGLVVKWGLGPLTEMARGVIDTKQAAQAAYVDDPQVDPLVPPIRVAGMLPRLTGPSQTPIGPVDPSTFVDLFGHDPRAAFHAHGEQVCASGCAASRHPTEELTRARFEQLIAQYASDPMSEESLAFETLLYFGRQTREMLAQVDELALDPLRASVLARELAVTHAQISIRVVDEHGEIRTSLPPTSVPFDRRHVFDMDTNRVQPLVTSGTVKRVGLYHLWTRL